MLSLITNHHFRQQASPDVPSLSEQYKPWTTSFTSSSAIPSPNWNSAWARTKHHGEADVCVDDVARTINRIVVDPDRFKFFQHPE